MSAPTVIAVADASPAARAGVAVGDTILSIDGSVPTDVIEWRWLTDEADPTLEVDRGGLARSLEVAKAAGEPLGIEVHSALFDQVRTCDNHCEFCFIYQLPPNLRTSLYLKDDDYRLSFLYGNYTTLTRFTEADLERVITERLSPLNVSIHATDPEVRAAMLRNRRGATSLRWLRALLDAGIEVHGQVVCCPGRNDGEVLEATLAGVADRYPDLASLCVVPLGVSRWNPEEAMRPHTAAEATAVVDTVEAWQERFVEILGRRLVFAADEYYLLAGRDFPKADAYEGFPMHEDGVGMARLFSTEFATGRRREPSTNPDEGGFFAWVDGAEVATRYEAAGDYDAPAEGYRAPRQATGPGTVPGGGGGGDRDASSGGMASPLETAVVLSPSRDAPVGVLTGIYGAEVLAPLVTGLGRDDVRVIPVENRFFGGNVGVSGLLVGEDLARVLAEEPAGHRYLVPDACLSGGTFLDGTGPGDLPRPVEVVATEGAALAEHLAGARRG